MTRPSWYPEAQATIDFLRFEKEIGSLALEIAKMKARIQAVEGAQQGLTNIYFEADDENVLFHIDRQTNSSLETMVQLDLNKLLQALEKSRQELEARLKAVEEKVKQLSIFI
jgi:hypothetical protein